MSLVKTPNDNILYIILLCKDVEYESEVIFINMYVICQTIY